MPFYVSARAASDERLVIQRPNFANDNQIYFDYNRFVFVQKYIYWNSVLYGGKIWTAR